MNIATLRSGGSIALGLTLAATLSSAAFAQHRDDRDHDRDHDSTRLYPNLLILSRSVYDNKASNVIPGTILPPGCTGSNCAASTGAPSNGTYPYVFNNDTYDGSFGITSKIFLDQLTLDGRPISTIEVPNSDQHGVFATSDQLVTSFSSKSELGLHLSTDGKYLTFMGYVAPVNTLDVSNSNTPLAIDLTNPVGEAPVYRAVAKLGQDGKLTLTETNAYSGNNGRSAILNNSNGADFFYTAGNAGNGANPQPSGVVLGAGAQIITPSKVFELNQTPALPTPVASFSVTELGDKADKIGKDDNFRGMTVFNNVLYYTKGSGSNGVNTVYFVDTVGTACPNGVGLPIAGAKLPTTSLAYDTSTVVTAGLPSNMCILAGFPSVSNKVVAATTFPFGIWFADATTLYVANEGDGYTGGTDLYTHAAAQTTAGLQKWVFNSTTKLWMLAYTLSRNLGLGTPYIVEGYPTGTNSVTGLPWAPATDGLRNITGLVGPDGLVAIYGVTSTISGGGDQGADPNRLVVVIDQLKNTNPAVAAKIPFFNLKDAKFAEVLRGVSFTPGSDFDFSNHDSRY